MNQHTASPGPGDCLRGPTFLRFHALTAALLGMLVGIVGLRAQSPPALVSVSPANGSTDAAPRGSVSFLFDQDMDTSIPPLASVGTFVIGNYQFTPSTVNSLMSGRWETDKRTLTFQPSGAIALNTTVSWTLNPAGATLPFQSAAGQALATVTGSFKIASNSGGSTNETCTPVTPAPGFYTVSKNLQYLQSSAADPVVSSGAAGIFGIAVQGPSAGPAVTNGSITFPDGTSKALVLQTGAYRLTETYTGEAALETARPPGNYTLRFNQAGQPERVIPLAMPATPAIVPKIANYAAAQAIDATRDFTLQWNAYSPLPTGAIVRVVIIDEFGNRIFLAPNPCVPRTLDPAATSIVIPANYLRPGFNYNGLLVFVLNYYNSTTDVDQMTGNGFVQRTTTFTLKTITGTNSTPSELCTPTPVTTGAYSVLKVLDHQQLSADTVVLRPGLPALFAATVQSPPAGPDVSGGTLTLPNATDQALTNLASGLFGFSASFGTEAALEGAYAEGDYTLKLDQTGQPQRVIPMTMPATPSVVPMIVNYAEAQAIEATNDFTLRWNAFSPQGPGAFVRVIISDDQGNLVFMAPNPCIPRALDPTATSVVIPANYFHANSNYHGELQFGLTFYSSTTDVTNMVGYGAVQRNTDFDLKAAGAVTVAPARFTGFRVLANGHPEINITGTAGKPYTIQRSASLRNPAWSGLSPVTPDGSGSAVFEDTDPTLQFPAFYRAVSQ